MYHTEGFADAVAFFTRKATGKSKWVVLVGSAPAVGDLKVQYRVGTV